MPTLYQGRYNILKTLGTGGFGAVYLAADEREGGRQVALKCLVPPASGDADDRAFAEATFHQEFKILTHLAHPYICRVFDYGIDAETKECYFTAEYIEGTRIFEATASLDCAAIESLFVQSLRAIGYLHSNGIVHGDIKPPNLLVTMDDAGIPAVKLLDFGLSQHRGAQWTVPRGTLKYMAPEQLLPDYPSAPHADLYALGLLFYQLFTRQFPYRLGSTNQLIEEIRAFMPKSPQLLRPDLPAYLAPIILRLLAKNPAERFSRADRVIAAVNVHGPRQYPVETRETLASYAFAPALIARERELAAVRAVSVGGGPAVHAVIFGESGCGKTRLLREAYYAAQMKGIACHWLEQSSAVVHCCGTPLPNISDEAGLVAAAQRLLAVGPEGPAAYFLDNVETYDPLHRSIVVQAMRLAMRHVGEGTPRRRFVIAHRGVLSEAWGALAAESLVAGISVEPFTCEQTHAYLEGFTGIEQFPPEFVDRFFALTGGIPRLCEEVLRALIDAGQLRDRAQLTSIAALPLPTSGLAVVVEKWKGLPPAAQALMRWLALYQQPIAVADVASCAAMPIAQVHEAVAVLESAQMIRRWEGAVAPANTLIAEAIAGAVPEPDRIASHRAIAEWLERHDGSIGARAHHWYAAGDASLSGPLLSAAGRDAWARLDIPAAIRWWERALATATAESWGDVAEELVRAYATHGAYEKATALCETMRQRAGADPRRAAYAVRGLGWIASKQGWFDRAATYFEEALHMYQSLGATETILVQNDLGHIGLQRNDALGAIAHFSAAWEAAARQPDVPIQYIANNQLATALAADGRVDDARTVAQEKTRTLAARGDERHAIGGLAEWGRIVAHAGALTEAATVYRQAIAAAEKTGALHNVLGLADNYIGVCQLLGRYRDAFAMLERALAIGATVGTELELAHCWMTAANLYACVGVFAQARAYGDLARAVFARRELIGPAGWIDYSDGCWADEEGDITRAGACFTRALDAAAMAPDPRLQAFAGVARAHVTLHIGNQELARQYFTEATLIGAALSEEEWQYRQRFTAMELALHEGQTWTAAQTHWMEGMLNGESRERRLELLGLVVARATRDAETANAERALHAARAIIAEIRAELDESYQDDYCRQRRIAVFFKPLG